LANAGDEKQGSAISQPPMGKGRLGKRASFVFRRRRSPPYNSTSFRLAPHAG
jgi:hypothetical protein